MRWGRKPPAPEVASSEGGFFELTGRTPDLPLRDVFVYFRDLVSSDIAWTDSRKRRHR